MKKKALIVLARGFEETETVIPIDVLRRSGVDVTIAGVGSKTVTGAHNITIYCEKELNECEDDYDVVILPGGMPGAENLAGSMKLKSIISETISRKKIIAAICASPTIVLAPMGILDGKKATCYPGMEKSFSSKIFFIDENVVKDGNILTSKGPGTALSFALKIAESLVGKDKSDMIAEQMIVGTV
ncbi:MAG: DJ-1 family glyoxalase III [Candidatus Omnitrophota bacterium]